MTAFWDLPLRRIERILVLWLTHRIPLLRLLGRGLKGLCLQAIVSMPGVLQCTYLLQPMMGILTAYNRYQYPQELCIVDRITLHCKVR